jgi:SAM-dependent methyltransferase
MAEPMGMVLDNKSIKLYEKWLQGHPGRALDGFILEMVSRAVSPQKNDRILDIGCGTGDRILSLKSLGLDISGVDASPDMIDIAKNRLGNSVELKTGQAEDLPFSDNEFEMVLLINTLEFLDDPLKALKEAGRVAKKKVLICIINSLSFDCLAARVQGIFREILIRHIRPYHLWEMKSLIRKAYGPVPVFWMCPGDQAAGDGYKSRAPEGARPSLWPFGPLLGISVVLTPFLRTESSPLKIVVNKIEEPFAEGIPIQNQQIFKIAWRGA